MSNSISGPFHDLIRNVKQFGGEIEFPESDLGSLLSSQFYLTPELGSNYRPGCQAPYFHASGACRISGLSF
jgi:hypothetical protein